MKFGADWVLTIDIEDGAQCDLLKKSLQNKLHKLLAGGVFIHFSAAPVYASFSLAFSQLSEIMTILWECHGFQRKTEGRECCADLHIHVGPLMV